MKLVLVALVAGCHTSTPRPDTSGPPYLALFERGRHWTLPIESERRTVTCEVADVNPLGNSTVARVRCAKPYAGLLVAGTWVATPAGLYHPLLPVDDPDDLALLGEDDLLIAARPHEREHSHVIDGAQESIEAFAFDRSWCVRDLTATAADRRGFTLCFDASGITGGDELVIVDGRPQRTRFGVAPPEDHEE